MNRIDRIQPCKAPLRSALIVILLASPLAGCGEDMNTKMDEDSKDVDIKIFLKPVADSDSEQYCPHSVNKTNPNVWRGKFVTWQTYLESDHDQIVEDYKFAIYFDPIQGNPLQSSSTGKLSRKIDSGAPVAQYKYTIWDAPANGKAPVCQPLDPLFRVN